MSAISDSDKVCETGYHEPSAETSILGASESGFMIRFTYIQIYLGTFVS